jgi:hypothetical protein
MREQYQARWISRGRAVALKKTGRLGSAILLDSFNGYILVEPAESGLGDGAVLSPQEADYELQPVWYIGPKAKLRDARSRLGLEALAATPALAGGA